MNKLFNRDNFLCGVVFLLTPVCFRYAEIYYYFGFNGAWTDILTPHNRIMYELEKNDLLGLFSYVNSTLAMFVLGMVWGYVATKYDNQVKVFWVTFFFSLLCIHISTYFGAILMSPSKFFYFLIYPIKTYPLSYLLDLAKLMAFLLFLTCICHKFILKKDQKLTARILKEINEEKLNTSNPG